MLAAKLRARIAADGPMPFEQYMAACLYDPDGGFFTTGPLRSVKEGDFLTSPEVSPWFGRTLGRFIESQVASHNWQDPFLVVDVGAGSGSLLKPLMSHLVSPSGGGAERSEAEGVKPVSRPRSDPPPGPDGPDSALMGEQYEFHAVEASPAARQALAGLLDSDHVHETIDDLPERFDGVIIANELLDNFPVALAVRSADGWVERWVGATETAFELVTADARPEVVTWCHAYAGKVQEGGMVEVELAATDWVSAMLDRLERGALVVVDYGGTAEELEPRRTQGTLRTYQRHHLGPDPLLEPGATDVTVDVNFTALIAAAEAAGATVKLYRQDDFLADLGLRDVIKDLRHRELDLAKGDDAMARLKVRSEATDARTLLHPRGLGDFRVMVAN
ncbi:MAG: SAM-dependent methyltransferase [Actinobacteria bacterium]|nr:SAM-dependent methyltransferase [Actinomycetota bacterium]